MFTSLLYNDIKRLILEKSDHDILEIIVSLIADTDYYDKSSDTALKILQQNPRLVYQTYKGGNNLLHYAVQHINGMVIRFLLDAVPHLAFIENDAGLTPWHTSFKYDPAFPMIADFFLQTLAGPIATYGAIESSGGSNKAKLSFVVPQTKPNIRAFLLLSKTGIIILNTQEDTLLNFYFGSIYNTISQQYWGTQKTISLTTEELYNLPQHTSSAPLSPWIWKIRQSWTSHTGPAWHIIAIEDEIDTLVLPADEINPTLPPRRNPAALEIDENGIMPEDTDTGITTVVEIDENGVMHDDTDTGTNTATHTNLNNMQMISAVIRSVDTIALAAKVTCDPSINNILPFAISAAYMLCIGLTRNTPACSIAYAGLNYAQFIYYNIESNTRSVGQVLFYMTIPTVLAGLEELSTHAFYPLAAIAKIGIELGVAGAHLLEAVTVCTGESSEAEKNLADSF